MACKCAKFDESVGRYQCDVSGSECIYMMPNSKRCAEEYGEGPDAQTNKCEDCFDFYQQDGRRCCKKKPLCLVDGEFINSEFIEDEVVCCGGYTPKN